MDGKFGANLEIRPCTLRELADYYGVGKGTLRNWLQPFAGEIGQRIGNRYTVLQVGQIVKRLGLRGRLFLDNKKQTSLDVTRRQNTVRDCLSAEDRGQVMDGKFGANLEVRPYTLKELANYYGIGNGTLRRLLKSFENEIGPRIGNYYSALQVRVIILHLDGCFNMVSKQTSLDV